MNLKEKKEMNNSLEECGACLMLLNLMPSSSSDIQPAGEIKQWNTFLSLC